MSLPVGQVERVERLTVSVVMAVRNEEANIDEQLAALARQTYGGEWEVVVVDNSSEDGTVVRATAWADRLPRLRVVAGPAHPSMARSLNIGVALADGDLLAFCDGDDVVGDGWVAAMAEALASHPHITGPLDLTRLSQPATVWGAHTRKWMVGPPHYEFLPFAMGCNSGWRREAFEMLGGFDETLPSGQDKDLSWRAQLADLGLWFEPAAIVHRRPRATMSAAFDQHVRYGRSTARLYVRFRPYGMSRRTAARRIFEWAHVAAHLPWLLVRNRRVRVAEVLGLRLGRCLPLGRSARSNLQLRPEHLGKDPAVDRIGTRPGSARPEVLYPPSAR